MTPEQEEAIEAALLAGMVKSKMRNIDSMMESRPDVPADKINLHEFVRQTKQVHQPTPQAEINHQVHAIPSNNFVPNPVFQSNVKNYDNLESDIKNINTNLEKINNNLTKLTGMFGKVFQNITKSSNK
jgi:hypothetical protein